MLPIDFKKNIKYLIVFNEYSQILNLFFYIIISITNNLIKKFFLE